jgi:hypothetical protein
MTTRKVSFKTRDKIEIGTTRTGRRTGQRGCDAAEIGDNSLDSVSFSFNFGLETLHLVAVEGVGDILYCHQYAIARVKGWGVLTRRILTVAMIADVDVEF